MPYRCVNCNRFVRILYKCPYCEHGHFECAECGELTEEDVEEV
jgi:DNA-directed RNA polymerase subunit RPC12/RpoP